jgi:hypothetical protein
MNTYADVSLLQAALVGYRVSREKINERIAAIMRELDGDSMAVVSRPIGGSKAKRHMSAAARERIAAANRKRWAAFRALKRSAAAEQASPKRKLSTAARAQLAANLQKGRDAKAAKRATASSRA